MSIRSLLFLYRRRLAAHAVSELLALLGIAAGVALVFAVQVANSGLTGSVDRLNEGVAGAATLQLAARSPDGFDLSTFRRVERLQGVRRAAPVLELRAALRGPLGRHAVILAGADERLVRLGGSVLREFALPGLGQLRGLALPAPLARSLGVQAGDRIMVEIGGQTRRATILGLLEPAEVGPLANSSIVAASLGYVQALSGSTGRVTRALVAPEPGREAAVRDELNEIAAGRLDVGSSDTEARLLRQAAVPHSQSTAMFAAISALVGFLFALNAMLLTAPERRRFIAALRLDGYDARAVVQIVVYEGLVLGTAASLVGLLLGDQLSRHLFEATPGYLSFAFTIDAERIVTGQSVAISFASGLVAALLATARPLGELWSRAPIDAPFREDAEPDPSYLRRPALLLAATALLLGAGLVLAVAPAAFIGGMLMLVAAMLLAIPAILRWTLRLVSRLGTRPGSPMLLVAIGELRASAIRASALAATGALAVFGAVAVGGAHRDLLRGLDDNSASFVGTADVWVTAGGDENGLTSGMFHPRPEQFAALRRSRDVSDVRVYRGGLLDVAGRRVGVVARPRRDSMLIPERQVLDGDLDRATSKLRAGGWIAVSKVVTDDLDLNVGDRMRLPTPSGTKSLRVAATLTNFGWAPGVLVLNADEFRSHWRTDAAAALEIDLRRGVTPKQGKRAVRQAVGADPALVVETAAERASRFERLSRQGLERLSQISVLVVIAAILALAAAMGAVLWQRRPRLAQLKLSGFRDVEVWRALLFETSIVLSIGCSIGAATGLLGQALLARALEFVTGFPVEYAAAAKLALIVLCGIALVATAVTAVPGWAAARVPPVLGLQEE